MNSTGIFDFESIRKRLDQLGEREVISRPIEPWVPPEPETQHGSACTYCGLMGICAMCAEID